jgi:hypothetical protein
MVCLSYQHSHIFYVFTLFLILITYDDSESRLAHSIINLYLKPSQITQVLFTRKKKKEKNNNIEKKSRDSHAMISSFAVEKVSYIQGKEKFEREKRWTKLLFL